jgi:hypothetical protein
LCAWAKQTERAINIEHKVEQQEITAWVTLSTYIRFSYLRHAVCHVATDDAVSVRGLNSESMLWTKFTHYIKMQHTPPYYSVTDSSVTTCLIIYWIEKVSFVVTATMNNCIKSLKQWIPNCWISPPGKPSLSNNG